MKKIKFNFKLNRRGVILLTAVLFSLSAVATLIIIGAVKAKRNTDRQAGIEVTITPEPTAAVSPSPGANETGEITPLPSVTPSPTPVITAENFIFPQEGKRPVAVMIDNEGKQVLPQGGIGQAQIVYETIIEYGDTRYMALFWDNIPKFVGPVRSSRHYFLDYAMEYDAIYTHIGGSNYAYRDLELFQVDDIDGVMSNADPVFWDLTRDKSNYHDTYTSQERIEGFIKKSEFKTETGLPLPFTYHKNDTDLNGTKSAKEVFIKYSSASSCGFYYDSSQKNYKRTRVGEFQLDRNTEEIIRAKNIIILFVKNEPIPLDSEGRQEVYTTGTGNGYFITNGTAEEIIWEKASRTSQTKYLDKKGKEIVLNPGQTWIQIVSPNINVKIN